MVKILKNCLWLLSLMQNNLKNEMKPERKQKETSDLVHNAWHNASQWLKELPLMWGGMERLCEVLTVDVLQGSLPCPIPSSTLHSHSPLTCDPIRSYSELLKAESSVLYSLNLLYLSKYKFQCMSQENGPVLLPIYA